MDADDRLPQKPQGRDQCPRVPDVEYREALSRAAVPAEPSWQRASVANPDSTLRNDRGSDEHSERRFMPLISHWLPHLPVDQLQALVLTRPT